MVEIGTLQQQALQQSQSVESSQISASERETMEDEAGLKVTDRSGTVDLVFGDNLDKFRYFHVKIPSG